METVIEARQVGRDYGLFRAVEKIQFEVQRGHCLGLAGGVNAGKTTMLRLLAAILPPSRGELFVLDLNTRTNAAAIRRRLGFMPERHGLDLELTVLDNLMVFGSYFSLGKIPLRAKARELLRLVQLDEIEDWPTLELKRHQLRRLALARALINEPEILLLDSPVKDLAPSERQFIWQIIERQKEKGLTIIVAGRDLDEFERFCDRVIFLDRGKVTCQGQPQTLVNHHVGRDVVEYDIASGDLDYHLEALAGRFQYQVVADRLKVFVPESVDTLSALRIVPSPRVVYRRARLSDVYIKLMGQDIAGGRS